MFDDHQEEIGSIQRAYRNKLQQMSNFIVNIKALDINNEVVSKETLMKSKWKGYSNNNGNFTIVDRTKISTNPRWEIQTSDGNYRIK